MTHSTVRAGKYSTTLHLEVDVGALSDIFSTCHLALMRTGFAAPAIPATPPVMNDAWGKAHAWTQDTSQMPGTRPDAHLCSVRGWRRGPWQDK